MVRPTGKVARPTAKSAGSSGPRTEAHPSAGSARASSGTARGGASRPAATGRRPAPPVPPTGWMRIFTVRAAVLLLVTLMGFILIMPTALQYGKQRTANQLLAAQLDASLAANAELENERNRWQDPRYVIAQARERLTFVFPGETPYRVIDPDSVVEEPVVDPSEPITDGAVTTGLTGSQAWYSTIWESVQIAGNAS